jgi:hypothetical protein
LGPGGALALRLRTLIVALGAPSSATIAGLAQDDRRRRQSVAGLVADRFIISSQES